jgi:prepilin-type N-terminal cleavage/methylation domain-containing protein
MKNKNQKGFTLIELLIVIGIIAILAAAVIIAINPGQQFQQARNATRWSHINSVVNSVYSYMISEAGSFPDCLYDGETPYTTLIDIHNCAGDLDDHIGDLPADPQIGGGDYAARTGVEIGGNTYDIAACEEGASCSGYVIQLDGNRIVVTSAATEATTNDIIVVQ